MALRRPTGQQVHAPVVCREHPDPTPAACRPPAPRAPVVPVVPRVVPAAVDRVALAALIGLAPPVLVAHPSLRVAHLVAREVPRVVPAVDVVDLAHDPEAAEPLRAHSVGLAASPRGVVNPSEQSVKSLTIWKRHRWVVFVYRVAMEMLFASHAVQA